MPNFRSSTAMVIEFTLLHQEDEECVKICISYLVWYFHFLHAVTFLHVLYLDVQIEIETESKNEISLCMAIMLDHPWQFLYTQCYRTV